MTLLSNYLGGQPTAESLIRVEVAIDHFVSHHLSGVRKLLTRAVVLHKHRIDLLENLEVARRGLLFLVVRFELTRRHFNAHLGSNEARLLHLNYLALDLLQVLFGAVYLADRGARTCLGDERQRDLWIGRFGVHGASVVAGCFVLARGNRIALLITRSLIDGIHLLLCLLI